MFIFVLWMVFDCIYDNQGLIPAMEMLFPTVEHRFCMKHIYNNFKLNFKGLELKATLWRCAMEWGPVGSSGSCPLFIALINLQIMEVMVFIQLGMRYGEPFLCYSSHTSISYMNII